MGIITTTIQGPIIEIDGATPVSVRFRIPYPEFPDHVHEWTNVEITGRWLWCGNGNIQNLSVGDTQTTEGTSFTYSLTPDEIDTHRVRIDASGSADAAGMHLTWSTISIQKYDLDTIEPMDSKRIVDLDAETMQAVFHYDEPTHAMYCKVDGALSEVGFAYRKIGAVWVRQPLDGVWPDKQLIDMHDDRAPVYTDNVGNVFTDNINRRLEV